MAPGFHFGALVLHHIHFHLDSIGDDVMKPRYQIKFKKVLHRMVGHGTGKKREGNNEQRKENHKTA